MTTWDEMLDAQLAGLPAGSATSAGSAGSDTPPRCIIDETVDWFERYVLTMSREDLPILALFAVHTHCMSALYTTPRVVITSPVPGSGKTTVLEHMERLTYKATQAASLSSAAMLARLTEHEPTTLLVDEADRTLDEKREIAGELFAVLNSGYKRGGSRPVLVAVKDGWDVRVMPTFAPVMMAGNNPNLPDDTRSRTIPVLLMPDYRGVVAESDWEEIDDDARALGGRIAEWAALHLEDIRGADAFLPDGVRGRARERWKPFAKIAAVAGGDWPATVHRLAQRDIDREALDREDGMVRTKPHMVLVADLASIWQERKSDFTPTSDLIRALVAANPRTWGEVSAYGKELTAQRMGRMLVANFGIHSTRLDPAGPRGYTRAAFERAWDTLGIEPAEPADPAEPASGSEGRS